MKEYIERAVVEEMLENAQIITDGENCGYCTDDVDLNSIPAADVVKVVRCRNCKHLMFSDCYGECRLGRLTGPVQPEDFCGMGERRSDSNGVFKETL